MTRSETSFLWLSAVVSACELRDACSVMFITVDVEQAVHALATWRGAQAHAGIDVLLGKLGVIALAVRIELAENVVPDLDVPVTVAADGAVGLAAAVFFAAVVYPRSRAAGAGAVLSQKLSSLPKKRKIRSGAMPISSRAPDVERLVVVNIDGRIEPVRVDAYPVGLVRNSQDQACGLVLEVVAEGEVAEHFKVGAVPRCLADVLDVAGADALAGADAGGGAVCSPVKQGFIGHAGL